jgi:hypothetical protein
MMQQLNAPKRVVRDAQGRVSHVEPMLPATPDETNGIASP